MPSVETDNEMTVESQESSIHVFRRFITTTKLLSGAEQLDASKVVRRECYQYWLTTRAGVAREPEKNFQRTLTAHLTGSDGRQPFPLEEETAILQIIRKKSIWYDMHKNIIVFVSI